MAFFTDTERAILVAAAELVLPGGADQAAEPGAAAGEVAGYLEALLTAFDHDPPRIWCGGPWADRGGDPVNHYLDFMPLGRLEELAWRTRIEGSAGLAEREFNGPVRGYQQVYREGLAALGAGFPTLPDHERAAALEAASELSELLFTHACEALYAAPEYGGNPGMIGWTAVGYDGDTLPRGWTDDEVTYPLGLPLANGAGR